MEYPSLDTAKAGAIRFNTDSSQLEIYDGNQWVGVLATSPELQTDGKYSNAGTRGIVMGGLAPGEPAGTNMIQYLSIATTGDTGDFGDLTRKKYASMGGISSRTRGILPGGYFYNQPSGPGTYIDDMDVITISILGNASDFGNLSQGNRAEPGSASNETRGIVFGGSAGPSPVVRTNNITYVTIASSSDTIDFGDMTALYQGPTGTASQTRLVMGTGEQNPDNSFNSLEYITISTLGNAADFGDSTITAAYRNACGNAVRGVIAGGYHSPGHFDTIDYITISTLGNAIDFGNLIDARAAVSAMSSPTRAVFAGGNNPSRQRVIQFHEIMSTGNTVDFGDLEMNVANAGQVTNGHGGL